MAEPYIQGDLFPSVSTPEGTVVINGRCLIRTQDRHRVVIVSGILLSQYALGDRMAEAYAMVNLVEQGWADQNDVARAFGCSERTIRRHQQRFEEGGLPALGHGRGFPKGRQRLGKSRTRLIQRLKAEGHSNCEIGRRVGISEKAVRKTLRRLGWKPQPHEEALLPLNLPTSDPKRSASSLPPTTSAPEEPSISSDPKLSAFSSAANDLPSLTLDQDPDDRSLDRFLAYLGLIDDAVPLFRSRQQVPHAGVLLAIAPLLQSGVFECAQEIYGGIGPAFYGLRTSLLALLLMALLRIKRPEGLKEHPPAHLGHVLGLDRAPEVKTLRRKLARLASLGRAADFGRALTQRRVALLGEALGFLYVDGHVRVYHGRHPIPKAHVARLRLSVPATSDYWVNDRRGDPLFVVTAEANAGLVRMLPVVLGEIRALIGERRLTVVFDRGGYSPRLFVKLIAAGFDLITYRKGRFPRTARRRFAVHRARIEGQEVTYTLADQGVLLLGGKLRLRQVTRLSETGHQTPILTSRRDLPAIEVAFRMFERWRQENFFKYLREEYALDALAEYALEPDNPTREVPNPVRARIDAELRKAREELDLLKAQYGLEAFSNPEHLRQTMRGFKIAHSGLGQRLRVALRKVYRLEDQRASVPARVPVETVADGPVVKLAPERKHLTNLLKMVAYQAESELFRTVAPYYRRTEDEGRTLIQNALESDADLELTAGELRVTLAPLSSAHRTRAVAALCEELDRQRPCFPGTRLRLRYRVKSAR